MRRRPLITLISLLSLFAASLLTPTVTAAGAPAQLAFITPVQTLAPGACSATITVQTQDFSGSPSNVLSPTVVSLSSSTTSGTFDSDAGCTATITSVTITTGTNSASFFYKDVQIATLTASSLPLTPASQVQNRYVPGSTSAVATPTGSSYVVTSVLGESFTASVNLANAASVIGFDYLFTWNPSLLKQTGVLQGDWAGPNVYSATANTTFTGVNDTTQGAGTLHFGQTQLGGSSITIGSVPVTLFTVDLQFKAAGLSPLNIPSTGLTGTGNPLITFCVASPCNAAPAGVGTVQTVTNGNAVAPPFGMATSPGTLSLAQGSSGTSTITATSLFGFSGAIAVTAAFHTLDPFGPNATLNTRLITLSSGSSVSFIANIGTQPCTPAGFYNAVVTGTNGTLQGSVKIPVTVTAAPTPISSFCISASTNSVSVAPGGTQTVTINVCSANGFAGTVSLDATPVPIVHHRLKGVLSAGSVTVSAANACTGGTPVSVSLLIKTTTSLVPTTYELSVSGSVSRVPGSFTVITVTVT